MCWILILCQHFEEAWSKASPLLPALVESITRLPVSWLWIQSCGSFTAVLEQYISAHALLCQGTFVNSLGSRDDRTLKNDYPVFTASPQSLLGS